MLGNLKVQSSSYIVLNKTSTKIYFFWSNITKATCFLHHMVSDITGKMLTTINDHPTTENINFPLGAVSDRCWMFKKTDLDV